MPHASSSPVAIADAVLHAALVSDADAVWIEPLTGGDSTYSISMEHRGTVVGSASIDAEVATAVIARLALIASVDLTTTRAATGTIGLRTALHDRRLVVTIRPGTHLRAELVLVASGRPPVTRELDQDLAPGELVDRYRVIERLDSGGMGSVYRVEQVVLGRQYALKLLHAEVLRRDLDAIDRFVREARTASRIQHPHIVDVFDFGYVADGRPYFVMELMHGESLADLIDHRGALEPQQAFAIASQLADALCAAHDHGVIHADVTPSNTFLLDGDRLHVKLLDFGLAELRGQRVIETDVAFILGTPHYVSPEQLRGQPSDESSDQYALGIVLFEMLAGRPPFHDDDVRALCQKHLADPLPDVHSPFGPLPDECQAWLARALAKQPRDRHASMRVARTELAQLSQLAERRGWRRWLAS